MTGVISTPPMGGIISLVIFKKGSVGENTINQNLFLKFSCEYQLETILTRNASDKVPRPKPRAKWIFGRFSSKIGVTKL